MLQRQGIKKRRPWNLTYVRVHANFLANVEPSTITGSSIPSWMVEGLCCHCCYIWFPILTPDTAVMCDRSVRAEIVLLLSNVVIVSVVFCFWRARLKYPSINGIRWYSSRSNVDLVKPRPRRSSGRGLHRFAGVISVISRMLDVVWDSTYCLALRQKLHHPPALRRVEETALDSNNNNDLAMSNKHSARICLIHELRGSD